LPPDLGELGRALRVPGLEDLDHAREAVRDVGTGDTAVWNVRIVSCVPGSPIDCAAMIPTASPISRHPPVAEEDAVAGAAHAELAAALQHERTGIDGLLFGSR
jgi:hypothetical protein